jgi:hypothetical protein
MYAIVTDGLCWWIQGDEGRVNEEPWDDLLEAQETGIALLEGGKTVDVESYYVDHGDGQGPDWDDPRPLPE